MGRFDSGWQVLNLFACAAVVSVGIIFVLRLEAHKRYGGDDGQGQGQEELVQAEVRVAREVQQEEVQESKGDRLCL